MSLEIAEQSKQLLTCHISRWRLCHCSPQDNQSKSWKKCGLCFFCHWSFLMPLAPVGQSIQLLIFHVSRWWLFSSFTARQPIQISGKDVTSGFLSLGMVSMTTGNSLLLVYIRLGISSKTKKELKCSILWGHQQLSQVFFHPNIRCHASKLKRVVFLVASIATSRAEHTTFYMPYQQIETLLSLTTRQFLQWKFICIHIFRQSI